MMDEPSFGDFGAGGSDTYAFSPEPAVRRSPKHYSLVLSSGMSSWHATQFLCVLTHTSTKQKTTKAKGATKKPPAPKAPKAAKIPKVATPTGKKLVQTTIKATKPVSKKRPPPDSDDENTASEAPSDGDITALSNTPPEAKKQKKAPAKKTGGEPLKDIVNENMNLDGPSESKKPKSKTATEKYQKLSQYEHILVRPDTYIGSVEKTEQPMWVYNSETSQMEWRKVTYVPGLYKIFDEILVNAADNKQNDPGMKSIKVNVDRESGEISVENDGAGIPVEIHEVCWPG